MMDQKELTIIEHLVEFRKRFLAVVVCFFLVFCGSLLFADQVYQFITQGFSQKLIVLGPNDILWIYLRLASLMAFSLTLPFTVYQVWSFVRPALKTEEAGAVFDTCNISLFYLRISLWLLFCNTSFTSGLVGTR